MAKGLEGVAGLIEIGTVAVKTGTLMGEVNLSVEDGGIGVQHLVEVQHIGMDEVDPLILNLWPTGRALGLSFLGIGGETGIAHQHTQQDQQI